MAITCGGLRKISVAMLLGTALGIVAAPRVARASTIVPSDLASLSTETLSPVAGFPVLSNQPVDNGITSAEIATLTGAVYLDTGATDPDFGHYIYEVTLTTLSPMGGSFSSMTTQPLLGVTPVSQAGWSFSEAAALGGTGTSSDFKITLDNLSSETGIKLNWSSLLPSDQWKTGDSLTFFYESDLGPTTGLYYVQDDTNGSGTSYIPAGIVVPVPGAAPMGVITLAGLVVLGLYRRHRMG